MLISCISYNLGSIDIILSSIPFLTAFYTILLRISGIPLRFHFLYPAKLTFQGIPFQNPLLYPIQLFFKLKIIYNRVFHPFFCYIPCPSKRISPTHMSLVPSLTFSYHEHTKPRFFLYNLHIICFNNSALLQNNST